MEKEYTEEEIKAGKDFIAALEGLYSASSKLTFRLGVKDSIVTATGLFSTQLLLALNTKNGGVLKGTGIVMMETLSVADKVLELAHNDLLTAATTKDVVKTIKTASTAVEVSRTPEEERVTVQ